MLGKLLANISRRGSDEAVAQQPAAVPKDLMQFKPMVPLRPPPAHNDDGMRQVCKEVEQALRASGHLR